MRELNIGTKEHTTVSAVDEPSHGGACHCYVVLPTKELERMGKNDEVGDIKGSATFNFQKGPVKEHGVNGLHDADLLCILIDRLMGFQRGDFACMENYHALDHLKLALANLNARTLRRKNKGIEGTSQKDPHFDEAQKAVDEYNDSEKKTAGVRPIDCDTNPADCSQLIRATCLHSLKDKHNLYICPNEISSDVRTDDSKAESTTNEGVGSEVKEVDTSKWVCRVCGCTDENCSECIEATGEPCKWVEPNLCSRCVPEEATKSNPVPVPEGSVECSDCAHQIFVDDAPVCGLYECKYEPVDKSDEKEVDAAKAESAKDADPAQ